MGSPRGSTESHDEREVRLPLTEHSEGDDPYRDEAAASDLYATAELQRRHARTAIMIRKAQEQCL